MMNFFWSQFKWKFARFDAMLVFFCNSLWSNMNFRCFLAFKNVNDQRYWKVLFSYFYPNFSIFHICIQWSHSTILTRNSKNNLNIGFIIRNPVWYIKKQDTLPLYFTKKCIVYALIWRNLSFQCMFLQWV